MTSWDGADSVAGRRCAVHLYMGQQLIFAESMDKVGPPPAGLPACPASCTANFAGWGTDFVDNKYGDSGFL